MDIRIQIIVALVFSLVFPKSSISGVNCVKQFHVPAIDTATGWNIINRPAPMKMIYGDPGSHYSVDDTTVERKALFKTEVVYTNETYRHVALTNDTQMCLGRSNVVNPMVSVKLQPYIRLQLAKYMAYVFMYKQVRAECRKGCKYMQAFWRFPFAIRLDFKYCGYRCSEYDLTMIPFVVASEKIDGVLEEVLCKFSVSGKFVFALYVNVNELSVSPDFIEGSKCPDYCHG